MWSSSKLVHCHANFQTELQIFTLKIKQQTVKYSIHLKVRRAQKWLNFLISMDILKRGVEGDSVHLPPWLLASPVGLS